MTIGPRSRCLRHDRQGRYRWVDVRDVKGDILHEVPIATKGFEYLRRVLKFVRDK